MDRELRNKVAVATGGPGRTGSAAILAMAFLLMASPARSTDEATVGNAVADECTGLSQTLPAQHLPDLLIAPRKFTV